MDKPYFILKSKTKRKRKIITFFVLFLFIILISTYFVKVINPIIATYSYAKVNALTEQAVNRSSFEVLRSLNYESLVNIIKTRDEKISYIEAKTNTMNLVVRDIVEKAQNSMNNVMLEGMKLPLGTFSGISIFLGKGPNITLKLVPMGVVSTEIVSKFYNAGINNTIHRIYLRLKTQVSIVLPIKNNLIDTVSEIMLCENVIVGEVPNVYFESNQLQNKLDLLP